MSYKNIYIPNITLNVSFLYDYLKSFKKYLYISIIYMNLELHNDHIKSILESYKKKRQREILNYHTKIKKNPDLMEKRRETARQHYHNNKEKKKEYYEKNKEHIRLQRLASYY